MWFVLDPIALIAAILATAVVLFQIASAYGFVEINLERQPRDIAT
jgi:hypothetical protein